MKHALFILPTIVLPLIAISATQFYNKKEHLACDVPVQHFNDPALIQRGAYIATAGDCVACHTSTSGQPMAGGLAMPIPLLGTIYSSNITPNPHTGIGDWTFEEFDRAVRLGVSKNGKNLYPAMPYVSYSKISDDDIKALYAYFKYGVPAVNHKIPKSTIPWPLSIRWPLKLWNMVFAPTQPFQPKVNQSAEWNRGAYLVQGLAHCGTCHTPRGLFMQEKALDETHVGYVSGETLAGWQAYNITSDPHAGVGSWTPAQLTQYLHSGNVPDVAQAGGPMGEAVEHSFSKLSDADLSAMVTYMHSVPAVNKGSTKSRYAWGVPNRDDVAVRGEPFPTKFDPESLYLGACASCHQANGLGTSDHYYPSLVHNTTVGAMNPNNLVQVILHGLKRNTSATDNVGMPAFADEMSDAEIASLTNYLTKQFGNPDAIVVSERDVQKLRASN